MHGELSKIKMLRNSWISNGIIVISDWIVPPSKEVIAAVMLGFILLLLLTHS